jgi:hypothetical protein
LNYNIQQTLNQNTFEIDFKTDREEVEFRDEKLHQKLRNIVLMIAHYSYSFFDKTLTVTGVYRMQIEQDRIYKDNPKYKKKPWRSVHQEFRGVDLRVSNLNDEQIKTLLSIANTIQYDLKRPTKKTALMHDVGEGNHIHVQVMP